MIVGEFFNTWPPHLSFEVLPLFLHCSSTSSIFPAIPLSFSSSPSCNLSPELSLVFGQTTDTGTLSFTVPLGSVSNCQPGRGVRVQGCNFSHKLPSESALKIFVSHNTLTERVSTTETLNRCVLLPFALQVISSKCAHTGMSQWGEGVCVGRGLWLGWFTMFSQGTLIRFPVHSHTLLL